MSEQKKTMTEQLIEQLAKRGLNPHAEVRTAAGVADIVTDKAVYEVVPTLTPESLSKATDRVLSYRAAIGKGKKAVIYGQPTPGKHTDLSDAIKAAQARGVTVNLVPDGSRPGMT